MSCSNGIHSCPCGQVKVTLRDEQKVQQSTPPFCELKTEDGRLFYYFTSYPNLDDKKKWNRLYCVDISGFLRNHDDTICWTKDPAKSREFFCWKCENKSRIFLNNYQLAPFMNKYVDKEKMFSLAKSATGEHIVPGRIYVAVNEE